MSRGGAWRFVAIVIAFACATTALAAPVQISLYSPATSGGPTARALDSMVVAFERSNPGIRIRTTYAGSYPNVLAMALGKTTPTLAVLPAADLHTLLDRKAIVPFDTLARTAADRAWLGGFYPVLMANSQSGGMNWSIPFQRSTIVLCYNKDLFRAGGLEPSRAPGNWKQVAGFGGKLTLRDSSGKVTQWGVQIPSSDAPSWYFQALVGANERRLVNAAGTQASIDQPMTLDALTFWTDLVNRYKAHPAGIVEPDAMVRDFIGGKVAIIYTSTDNLPVIRDQAKFDLAVATLPSNMGRGSPTGGGNLYMFKQASPAQRGAAFRFVRWMTSAAQAAQWSIATGYVAVRADAWDTPAMKSHVAMFPAATVARDQLQQAFGELSTHDNERVTNALDENLRAALSGTKTNQQALQDAQSEVDRLLQPFRQ